MYDPENDYFNDECNPFVSENSTDIILYDRRYEFNKNNMSLCENICTFKGYENQRIKCECEVKLKFNSFLNINVSRYDLIYRFNLPKKRTFNFWVFKCFIKYHSNIVLLFNISSFFQLGIFFSFIITAFIFYKFGNNSFLKILVSLMKKEKENNIKQPITNQIKTKLDKNPNNKIKKVEYSSKIDEINIRKQKEHKIQIMESPPIKCNYNPELMLNEKGKKTRNINNLKTSSFSGSNKSLTTNNTNLDKTISKNEL